MHLVVRETGRGRRQLVAPPQEVPHPLRDVDIQDAKGGAGRTVGKVARPPLEEPIELIPNLLPALGSAALEKVADLLPGCAHCLL